MADEAAQDIDPSERITNALARLSESAKNINKAKGELSRPVAAVQGALKKLNIGVNCWTKLAGGKDEYGNFWSESVGYARHEKQWQIVIRAVNSNYSSPDQEDEEIWPFNEAPQQLRVKAAEKLPQLIEDLVGATDAAAKKLREKVGPTQELAAVVTNFVANKVK